MKVKTAREVMTPLEDAYMLEESCKLSFAVVRDIFDHGFSRVPVYARERQHVVGLLFVKDLIFVDPEDEVPLAEYLRVFERSIELVDGNAQCRERRLRMNTPSPRYGDELRRWRMTWGTPTRRHAIAAPRETSRVDGAPSTRPLPRSRVESRRCSKDIQARPRPPRARAGPAAEVVDGRK